MFMNAIQRRRVWTLWCKTACSRRLLSLLSLLFLLLLKVSMLCRCKRGSVFVQYCALRRSLGFGTPPLALFDLP